MKIQLAIMQAVVLIYLNSVFATDGEVVNVKPIECKTVKEFVLKVTPKKD